MRFAPSPTLWPRFPVGCVALLFSLRLIMETTMRPFISTLIIVLACAAIFGTSGSARAADCVVHFKRTACAGQETESFKKCDGKQECDETKAAATTEEACMKAALASCVNTRIDVTKYKMITATFKGSALTGGYTSDGKPDPKGTNFCAADRPDLNKCQ